MITGGTGSFGNAVLSRLLTSDIGEIRVFSRDEKKQEDMRRQHRSPKLKFYLGDVRDGSGVGAAMHGVDYIFHAAALKQVPNCEFFPMEAVKTNIIGLDNVLAAAIHEGVEKVICLSTDKAAYPINAMGMSKALMERVFIARSRTTETTTICGTRYGNVMCSRGSVIPLFVQQIKSKQPITVTNPEMTRFLMSLDEAVDLVLFAFQNGSAGDLFVQKAPACTIGILAQAVRELFSCEGEIHYIGIRHGEKMHETLLTREERSHAEDLEEFFRIPADNRDLNYAQYEEYGRGQEVLEEFNSANTRILSIDEVKAKLLALPYIQEKLKR